MKASLMIVFMVTAAIPVCAGNVTVNSSAAVTFLANGTSTGTDFPSAFTAANFSAAQTGSNAAVLSTTPFYTTSAVLTAAGAQWIGTSAGGGNGASPDYTALYAISFTIPAAFTSASLTLNYEVDNQLGGTNPGLYLNGIALPSSTGIPGFSTNSFNALHTYTDVSVGADLVQGTNWLYIDGVNLGAEGGLIFSANVSTTTTSPEPSAFWLLGTGLVLMRAASRLSRRRCATN
jgi:hypothetical protein